MGMSVKNHIVVGYHLASIFRYELVTKIATKFNTDTGEPYQKTEINGVLFFLDKELPGKDGLPDEWNILPNKVQDVNSKDVFIGLYYTGSQDAEDCVWGIPLSSTDGLRGFIREIPEVLINNTKQTMEKAFSELTTKLEIDTTKYPHIKPKLYVVNYCG